MRYGTPNTPMDTIRDFVTRGGIPVTIALLAVSVSLFLAMFFTNGAVDPFVMSYVAFLPANAFHAPWTIFTYPVVSVGFLSLLIGGFFFWLAGGSLERSWGSARYAVFFFALSAISALSLLLGTYLFERSNAPLIYGRRTAALVWLSAAAQRHDCRFLYAQSEPDLDVLFFPGSRHLCGLDRRAADLLLSRNGAAAQSVCTAAGLLPRFCMSNLGGPGATSARTVRRAGQCAGRICGWTRALRAQRSARPWTARLKSAGRWMWRDG